MKTLIGLGCSHTQGCAFVSRHPNSTPHAKEYMYKKGNDYLHELASDELKKHYGTTHITTGWLTDNLTWMGKLNKFLKYDTILNFGLGGMGIEANIRTMRNFIFQKRDLSDCLIIHQLPAVQRTELVGKKKDGEWCVTNQILWNEELRKENLMESILNWNKDYHANKFIWDIYYLQELIESKGGEYRCFGFDWNNNQSEPSYPIDIKGRIHEIQKFTSLQQNDEIHYEQYKPTDIKYVLNSINWLYLSNRNPKTKLHDAKLLNDDFHFTEEANETIAKDIYDGLQIYKLQQELK